MFTANPRPRPQPLLRAPCLLPKEPEPEPEPAHPRLRLALLPSCPKPTKPSPCFKTDGHSHRRNLSLIHI